MEMANSVTEMLKWEMDVPDYHQDGKLTVLDLKLYIDSDDQNCPIKHIFYKKPVSSRALIPQVSALPTNTKRPILIQEGLRRVRSNSLSSQLEEFTKTVRSFNIPRE